jgi:hypothetical protein
VVTSVACDGRGGHRDREARLGVSERQRSVRIPFELMQIDAQVGRERQGLTVSDDDDPGLGAQPAQCRAQPVATGFEIAEYMRA